LFVLLPDIRVSYILRQYHSTNVAFPRTALTALPWASLLGDSWVSMGEFRRGCTDVKVTAQTMLPAAMTGVVPAAGSGW